MFVRQAPRLRRFFHQQLGQACALGQLRRQDLERHQRAVPKFGVRGKVGGLPYLAHAALRD